jgi:hypothetical protein
VDAGYWIRDAGKWQSAKSKGHRARSIGHRAERKKMEDGMVRWWEGEKRLDRWDDGKKVLLNA